MPFSGTFTRGITSYRSRWLGIRCAIHAIFEYDYPAWDLQVLALNCGVQCFAGGPLLELQHTSSSSNRA